MNVDVLTLHVEEVCIKAVHRLSIKGHGIGVSEQPGVARLHDIQLTGIDPTNLGKVSRHLHLGQDTVIQDLPAVDASGQLNASTDDGQGLGPSSSSSVGIA